MKTSHLAAVICFIWGFQVRPFGLLRSGLGTPALLATEAVPCEVTSEENEGWHMRQSRKATPVQMGAWGQAYDMCVSCETLQVRHHDLASESVFCCFYYYYHYFYIIVYTIYMFLNFLIHNCYDAPPPPQQTQVKVLTFHLMVFGGGPRDMNIQSTILWCLFWQSLASYNH